MTEAFQKITPDSVVDGGLSKSIRDIEQAFVPGSLKSPEERIADQIRHDEQRIEEETQIILENEQMIKHLSYAITVSKAIAEAKRASVRIMKGQ